MPFQAFYSASKAALGVMMSAVRMEGRTYGITACTVNPGDVRSGFTGNRKQCAACVPGSPYYELSMRSINRMKRDEMAGMAPEVVADLLCRLVEVRRLKPRYIIELKYKFLVFLKRFLPDSVVEKLLMGIYLAPSKETRSERPSRPISARRAASAGSQRPRPPERDRSLPGSRPMDLPARAAGRGTPHRRDHGQLRSRRPSPIPSRP